MTTIAEHRRTYRPLADSLGRMKGVGCIILVKEEREQLDHLMAQPLPQFIMPTAGPFEDDSKRFGVLFVCVFCLFAVGTGCDNAVFPKTDKLPWEAINEALTGSIEGLTALNWVYNNDESGLCRKRN